MQANEFPAVNFLSESDWNNAKRNNLEIILNKYLAECSKRDKIIM